MAKTTDFTNFANERPNYFPGQYLLEDDFEIQHKYLSDRQRYHHQTLHISGIIEGLEVEVITNTNTKSVLVKSGSAVNSTGDLIILKANITFSDFKNLTDGELYIQYAQDKQLQQQKDIADSYTRWQEKPIVGFAATTPVNSVKLAKLAIRDTIILDLNLREYSGLSLPNPNSKALTLRSAGNTNPNLAVLTGSLKIDGDLTLGGNIQSSNSSVTNILSIGDLPKGGNRDWMMKGMNISWDTDNLFIGLKNEGTNRKDAVIAWGDDPQDDLRFINVLSGGAAEGNELVRIKANGNVGIGINDPGDYKLNVQGNTYIKGVISGAANGYQKAQFTLSGGGTVTWEGVGKRLKWTARFIGICMESSTSFPAGYIDIIQPSTNIPATQVYDGKARDANASGVVLNDWEALYAVHTIGGDQTQVSFQIVRYTNSFNAPSNWLLVAVVNGDDKSVKLGTGITIPAGGTSSSGKIDATSITTGQLDAARIPNLAASKITSGELDAARIPNLPTSKITSGELAVERIPNLPASKITTGTITGDLTISGNLQTSNTSVTNVLAIGDAPMTGNTGGSREWMTKGMKIFWDSDNLFIGLKDEGKNRKDAIIAWGDDADDDLRFINVLSGGAPGGNELVRIKANGNVGIGINDPGEYKLNVQGNQYINGNLTVTGSLSVGVSVGSTTNIDLSGHVQLKEYGKENIAYLQARDDSSNRDIGLRIRTQTKGTKERTLVEAVTITAGGEIQGKIWYSDEYTWTNGKADVKMGHSNKCVAFITYVQGKFAGAGEQVFTYIGSDGYWYLGGKQGGGGADVAVKARCIGSP